VIGETCNSQIRSKIRVAQSVHLVGPVTDRPRIIVALPDPSECAAVAEWLSADGYEPINRSSPQAAADEMRDRPFALLIVDAAFAFKRGLHPQGAGKYAPAIVVGQVGSGPRGGESINGQTVYLTRPLDRTLLGCFVSMAILDGRPVRRSVRKPVNRFAAVVNGVPSHIVDVSMEGLRLEVPGDRRTALPPYFTVRVPTIGVAVTVQRMWARSALKRNSSIWYGGALSQNRIAMYEAWKRFVDTIPAAGESLVVNPEAR
jgi:hypothetical protein